MTLSQHINKQRKDMSKLMNQSILNPALPPSEAELEWVMSNPDAKAGATTVIDMLRWHCHLEQLATVP